MEAGMADPARKIDAPQDDGRMTIEEFFVWQLDQDARYELVDGIPVEMTAGASGTHDDIVVNIIANLGNQLRGKPCKPRTADTALRTAVRSLRRADVLVTCDPSRPDSYEALEPRLVVEVLSPSNAGVRWQRKLEEYRRHQKLQYILLVDSRVVAVTLFSRTETGWNEVEADTFADMLEMPALDCKLRVADIYEGTGLEPDAVVPRPLPASRRRKRA
jgi:Uma2 family endonuclease